MWLDKSNLMQIFGAMLAAGTVAYGGYYFYQHPPMWRAQACQHFSLSMWLRWVGAELVLFLKLWRKSSICFVLYQGWWTWETNGINYISEKLGYLYMLASAFVNFLWIVHMASWEWVKGWCVAVLFFSLERCIENSKLLNHSNKLKANKENVSI